MDISELLYLCEAYKDLGWSVQGQLVRVIEGNAKECNPNALHMLREFLKDTKDYGVEGCEGIIKAIEEASK